MLCADKSDTLIGEAKVFVAGDTLQLKDYSKTDWKWSLFDAEAKKKRHQTVFPKECEAVFELGAELARIESSTKEKA